MRLCGFILLIGVSFVHSKLVSLTCKDIRAFVNGHNTRRLKLAKGQVQGQPGADDMSYMIWDEELANKAASWASALRRNHNPDKTVASGRFITGENLYWTRSTSPNYNLNINEALERWFKEYTDYTFGQSQSNPPVGHYTQMAWADTTHVGCAVSRWQNGQTTEYFVVCNYGPAGNYVNRRPYAPSKKGSGKLFCSTGNCKKPFGKCRKN